MVGVNAHDLTAGWNIPCQVAPHDENTRLFGIAHNRTISFHSDDPVDDGEVLHQVGIDNSILDINATLKPHFAIVDGIVGMEGDGPIMGDPKKAGVLVMGRNLAAVDATCCRIMGIDPYHVSYLERADNWLGPISEKSIEQRGETLASVRTNFNLIETIPAHQGLRLV